MADGGEEHAVVGVARRGEICYNSGQRKTGESDMKKKNEEIRKDDSFINENYDTAGKRELVANEVFAYNRDAEKKALEAFLAGPASELAPVIQGVRDVLEGRLACVREGKAPAPLADYPANEMVRALSTRTYTKYMGRCVPDGFEDEDSHDIDIATLRGEVTPFEFSALPKLHDEWQEMVKEFAAYLHAAAVFAKSIASASARLYLRAWLILDATIDLDDDFSFYPWQELSADEAQQVVRLERLATRRLKVDVLLAGLPAFAPAGKPQATPTPAEGK